MSISFPSRRLVSQEDASMIKRPDVPRSRFVNRWTRKATYNAGYLYPVVVDEILPGDHMQYELTAYVRLETPLFPIFDNQKVETFAFFVPNRIVWPDNANGTPGGWEAFMGDVAASSVPTANPVTNIPVVTFTPGSPSCGPNTLYDHMGIPIGNIDPEADPFPINALPFRAYNLIWNDWFRDQNVQDKLAWLGDPEGPDTPSDYRLMQINKMHDYFTSCLPWPQKFIAPSVPIGGDAWVKGLGFRDDALIAYTGPIDVRESDDSVEAYAFYREVGGSDESDQRDILYADATAASAARPRIFADLSTATGVSINQLRESFLLQQLLERDARGGTRYTELVRSHFDVVSPDSRLQRPEFIGGGSTPLVITPIAQTAPTEDLTVGALGAAGTAAGQHRASFAATEHGFVIILLAVRSELSYQQGLHKMWTRFTRPEYYFPSLAGLGEQAVTTGELYFTGVPEDDDVIFGYQERWHEYRTRVSEVVGVFNSTFSNPIDQWHLAQWFETPPTLSPEFLQDAPPMSRVLAAGDQATNQQYLADILIQRTAVRPLTMFGTPVTLGRF